MANCPSCGTADFYPSFSGKGECANSGCSLFVPSKISHHTDREHRGEQGEFPHGVDPIPPWYSNLPLGVSMGAYNATATIPTPKPVDPALLVSCTELLRELANLGLLANSALYAMGAQRGAAELLAYDVVSWGNGNNALEVDLEIRRDGMCVLYTASQGITALTVV